MNQDIIIIGGGISGISTGVTLQLLGYDTLIYAKKTYEHSSKNKNPAFSSLFPAASIIPHSISSEHSGALFKRSQLIFKSLLRNGFPGVCIRTHFELFEQPVERPSYAKQMTGFQMIDELQHSSIPKRSDMNQRYGWAFDSLFADWPLYFPALIQLYKQSGGKVIKRKVIASDVAQLPASTLVNCSGSGSSKLFYDPSDNRFALRGHLLHKTGARALAIGEDPISYNYTPVPEIYSDAHDRACDVYCYPRKDGVVLGGSRQPGTLTNEGTFTADYTDSGSDLITVDGCSVPAPVFYLNRDILQTTFGLSLGQPQNLTSSTGYRYLRRRSEGLRLEAERRNGKQIIHNYGHGGAGVTLSWGCSLKVAQLITGNNGGTLCQKFLRQFSKPNFSRTVNSTQYE